MAWQWDDVRFFLAVARAGSLSGAARALGVGHVTVGRRITLLEKAARRNPAEPDPGWLCHHVGRTGDPTRMCGDGERRDGS